MADRHHHNKGHHNKGHHGLGYLSKFLDPSKPLRGQDLLRAAKAEARIQTAPQVHGYQRLAKELGREKRFEAKGLNTLGRKTARSVGNVYDTLANQAQQNLATQAALGNQLIAQTGQRGQQAGQELAQSQAEQLGGLARQGADQGSPAQTQLAQIVASQKAAAANDAKAAQAFASSQAVGSAQLSGNLATSSLLQGASQQAGIKNTILNRVAESDLKYGQDIREARGKAADARALKGSQIASALQTLRGQEQQFILGKMATKQRAQAAQLSAATSAANSRRTARSSAASRRSENRRSRRTARETHRHNLATEHSGQGQNRSDRHQAQRQREHFRHAIKHLANPVIGKKPASFWNPKHVADLEHYIRTQGSFGPNEVNLVAKIVHNLIHKGGKKHGHGGGKPPPHNI
jgi:hypothetical protein